MTELQHAIAQARIHQTAQGDGRRGTIPAPVMGWNTRDNVAEMERGYAIELDNFFPDRGRVQSRPGFAEYCELPDGRPVGTLLNHLNGATSKLFAFTDQNVYDVTDPENIVADVSAGITKARWNHATMNGNTLCVNGVDAPLRYTEGSTWSAVTFTGQGLAPEDLHRVTVFKNRFFFLEKDSPNLWYGDLNAVTGVLTKFPIGLVSEEGGNAVAIGSISMDTGQGVDDLFVVFMSRGQVIVYAGTDPGNVDTWQLSGVFKLGRVVGDRPLVQLGADVVCITTDGFIPLLQFLRGGRAQTNMALSDTIAPTVSAAIAANADEDGWQPVLFTPARWLLFNIPTSAGTFEQYVMHTQTGAWCRFTGLQARCWGLLEHDDRIFFGTADGRVMEANKGRDDDGDPIYVSGRGAYQYLGSPYDKDFRMLRAHVESDASQTQISIGASVDFTTSVPRLAMAALTDVGALWDEGVWDVSEWAAGIDRTRDWKGLGLKGAAISMHVAARTRGDPVVWLSSDLLYNQATGAIAGTSG